MTEAAYYASLGLSSILEKVLAGERLDREDGMALFACRDINALGALATHVRMRLHGLTTTYVVNRQINYTNVCVNGCLFCAFRRDADGDSGAFRLSPDDIMERVGGAARGNAGLDELHMVGGCHPHMGLDFFEDVLARVRTALPGVPVKAFTPVEIEHFARLGGIATREVLARLKKAGLDMLAGGGAEIFHPEIRGRLCPHKADADAWLRISGEAHELGLKSNCTMLFGHIENHGHRVDHLLRLREQQDKSGGFTCFIPLPFLTENSRLRLPDGVTGPERAIDQLATVAVARLLLDNIPHIKAYWVMLGVKMAQTALWYGADDLDGTIVEEHIGHMAGASSAQGLTIGELEDMISQSGFTPRRRNAVFEAM